MSELGDKQKRFTRMLGKLIVWAYDQGFELSVGDAYRSPAMAKFYSANGAGISNSLHCQRLAIDLNLFIAGEYQATSEAYLPLGEFWESLGGSWGGRFSRPDGNHFSLAHDGVR